MLSPYLLREADSFSYQFITVSGIKYYAYFLDYSYMFNEYPEWQYRVYTLNVDIAEGDPDLNGVDEHIGITIVEIVRIFFQRLENVCVFVCDNADERHWARQRKFNQWFRKYNDGNIIKTDGRALVEGVEILNSMLINRYNPWCAAIIAAFKELNASAGDK